MTMPAWLALDLVAGSAGVLLAALMPVASRFDWLVSAGAGCDGGCGDPFEARWDK